MYLNINKTNEVNEANFDKLNQREPDPYSPLNVNLLCSLCAELSMVTLSCELSIVLVGFQVLGHFDVFPQYKFSYLLQCHLSRLLDTFQRNCINTSYTVNLTYKVIVEVTRQEALARSYIECLSSALIIFT
jgi:hypothetical protein